MSRLLTNSKVYRDQLIAKNSNTSNSEYNAGHPNALSDGDEKGKGEKNGQVGGATDIAKRGQLEAKNLYNKNKEYTSGVA